MVSVGVYGKWVRGWGSVNLPSNHRNKHPPPPLATVISTLIYPVPHPPHQHTPLLQPLTPAVHQSHLTKAVFYFIFLSFHRVHPNCLCREIHDAVVSMTTSTWPESCLQCAGWVRRWQRRGWRGVESGEVISIIRHLTIWHKSAQLKGARMEGGWRGWGRVGGHPEEKLAIKYEKMLQLFSKWSFQRGYCGNADVAPERAPCRCASAMTAHDTVLTSFSSSFIQPGLMALMRLLNTSRYYFSIYPRVRLGAARRPPPCVLSARLWRYHRLRMGRETLSDNPSVFFHPLCAPLSLLSARAAAYAACP